MERLLGPVRDKGTLAEKVLSWKKTELEQAVIEAGGCAAEMRTAEEWQTHVQGKSVALEPLIHASLQPEAPRLAGRFPRPGRCKACGCWT